MSLHRESLLCVNELVPVRLLKIDERGEGFMTHKIEGSITVSQRDLERVLCGGCHVPMPVSGRHGGFWRSVVLYAPYLSENLNSLMLWAFLLME